MTTTENAKQTTTLEVAGRDNPVRSLALPGVQALTPTEVRRVASLERRAPKLIAQAADAGVTIDYLGIARLFDDHRLYPGVDTDWVLRPADDTEEVVIPRAERQALQVLRDAGMRWPVLYVAHEIVKKPETEVPDGKAYMSIGTDASTALVGPVPDPVTSLELGERLEQKSERIIANLRRGLTMAGKAAGTAITAPALLAGAALTGFATGAATLDPIVIGAVPATSSQAGKPAAFYVLARWEW